MTRILPGFAAVLAAALVSSPAPAAAPLEGDPVDCVNPLSGTNGDAEFSRGNTVAAIVMPFGMTTWAPQTDGSASPFYQMKHRRFEGIRATHQPSIWVRDYGDFLVMPVVGKWRGSNQDRASDFSHDREVARPYYYSVELPRFQTTLELVPTERAAFFRFNFPTTREAAVVFTVEGEIDAAFDPTKRRIRGKATHVTFGAPGGFGLFFVAEFDQPYTSMDVAEETRDNGKIKILTGAVHLAPTAAGRPVNMRIGTSFISYEQAERNLRNELPSGKFDAARAASREAWARALDRVEIKGGTPAERSTFYTSLYRALQFPRMFHEPDAKGKMRHYSPFANGRIFDGPLYTDDGLWDTYRAKFPLLVLFYPEHSTNIIEGWLNAYREGGRLPNWPSPGNRPCMIGSHSDSLLADAFVKGIKMDVNTAHLATRKNATEEDSGGWAGRDHLQDYIVKGYIPVEARKDAATSCTLEYAYDDWCASILATGAGRTDDASLFRKRSQNYKNVWDPKTGFMRGRQADGRFSEPFDPLAWGGAFVEGNAWQWLWSVMHDPYGLMELIGGPAATAKKLDELTTQAATSVPRTYGHLIHEMREVEFAKMGQYAHVNEPCQHVLYFYNYALQPWKTQAGVHRIMNELYNPDGMTGDDDTGQTSAWYVFNAAGFYPFCPGTSIYLIGSPLFPETTLKFPGGKSFVVRAKNAGGRNVYIQAARLDGKPYPKTWIDHATLTAGGRLEFDMGPQPNEAWGSRPADAPPNLVDP